MSKNIYGTSSCAFSAGVDECICVPKSSAIQSLTLIVSILQNLYTAIDRFYNPVLGVAPVVANMTMSASVSPPIFMRLRWIDMNPGVKFDRTIPAHLDGLRFIYNLYAKDWRIDPLFISLGMA